MFIKNQQKVPQEILTQLCEPFFILFCMLTITKRSVLIGVRLIIVKRYRFNNGSSEVLRIKK
ncbi:MAG: hypothetical protein ACJA2M_000066 [Polaribacter sp.]|jgi:hypothetical protein